MGRREGEREGRKGERKGGREGGRESERNITAGCQLKSYKKVAQKHMKYRSFSFYEGVRS